MPRDLADELTGALVAFAAETTIAAAAVLADRGSGPCNTNSIRQEDHTFQPFQQPPQPDIAGSALADFYAFLHRIVIAFDQLIFTRWSVRNVYIASWFYLILVYGIGTVSFHPTFNVSQNPFVNYYKDAWRGHYLYESLPLPLIAYFTGLSSNYAAFCLFTLVVLFLSNVFLTWKLWRNHGQQIAKLSIILFVLGPMAVVLLMFVGEYDCLTYLLQSLLFFCTNLPGLLLLGLAGGLQHFPVMVLSGISLLCFRSVVQRGKIPVLQILFYAGGAVGGSTLTKMFQRHYQLGIETGRLAYVLRMSKGNLIKNILSNWLSYLFSIYGVLWLLTFLLAWVLFRERRRAFWVFAASNAVFFVASQLVTDTTRVFALCSWPILLAATIWLFTESEDARDRRGCRELSHFVSGLAVAGLVIPHMIVWQGDVYSSFLKNTMMIVRDMLGSMLHRSM